MEFNKVKAIVDNIPNGRIFSVELNTTVKQVSAKAKKSGITVYKHSYNVCRKGIEYSNMNYIKQMCEELGYVIGNRVVGTKDKDDKSFVNNTLADGTEQKYLELFSMTCVADRINGNKPICDSKVEYIVDDNGVKTVVDYATLKTMGIMQPAFFTVGQKNEEKYNTMLAMKAEWEKDKANYPQNLKDELAKLIRHCYNKVYSPNVENIISIG